MKNVMKKHLLCRTRLETHLLPFLSTFRSLFPPKNAKNLKNNPPGPCRKNTLFFDTIFSAFFANLSGF